MKRILPLLGLFGAAVLLLATPGKTHKVDWCHFPPGQNGAKVNVLSIDEAADGSLGGQHLNHPGDGPVCIGPATKQLNGKTYDCADIKIPKNFVELGPGCGGSCSTIAPFTNPAALSCTIAPTSNCLCPTKDSCGNDLPSAGNPIGGTGTDLDPYNCGGLG